MLIMQEDRPMILLLIHQAIIVVVALRHIFRKSQIYPQKCDSILQKSRPSRTYPATTSSVYENPGSRRPSRQDTADPVVLETPSKPQCWEHGCNGRQFSTFSNLLRHQREKSGSSNKSVCDRCGAEFTRKTARDGHLKHDKCKQKEPGR